MFNVKYEYSTMEKAIKMENKRKFYVNVVDE